MCLDWGGIPPRLFGILFLMLGAVMGDDAQGASKAPEDGCGHLLSVSATLCTAKVSCPSSSDLDQEAEQVFLKCVSGEPVSLGTITELFSAYGSERAFQCCIGNALHRKHIGDLER